MLMALVCAWLVAPAQAQEAAPMTPSERVQVSAPYLDLRTGPGRGFPIKQVVPRGQSVDVLLRQNDWFRIRTDDGRLGWAHRDQLHAISMAAAAPSHRAAVAGWLHERVELGANWGRLESSGQLRFHAALRTSDALAIEASLGRAQGALSGAEVRLLNLTAEPWHDARVSPIFAIGFGRLRNVPNNDPAAPASARLLDAALGLRWRFAEYYSLRTDYRILTGYVGSNRIVEFREATLGLAFHF